MAFTHSGPSDRLTMTEIPLGIMVKENYEEILDTVRFIDPPNNVLLRGNDKIWYWERIYNTDENVFENSPMRFFTVIRKPR